MEVNNTCNSYNNNDRYRNTSTIIPTFFDTLEETVKLVFRTIRQVLYTALQMKRCLSDTSSI